MSTYDKHTQFILRIEFHGASETPDVYSILHEELAENIFHDQYRDNESRKYFDLARATYSAEGPFTGQTVLKHAQDVVNTTIARATRNHPEIDITASILVIKGEAPYPFSTNAQPVPKRPFL